MAILSSEIKFYYTGGSSNGNANLSLGGVISSVQITPGNLHNLFDKVSGTEATSGNINYRSIGVKNTNGTLTFENVKTYILQNTPASDDISISYEKPVSNAVQTIANETTAPTGISFSTPTDRTSGLTSTGEGDTSSNVSAGKWFAVWIKRNVPAGTSGYSSNNAILKVDGDTAI